MWRLDVLWNAYTEGTKSHTSRDEHGLPTEQGEAICTCLVLQTGRLLNCSEKPGRAAKGCNPERPNTNGTSKSERKKTSLRLAPCVRDP